MLREAEGSALRGGTGGPLDVQIFVEDVSLERGRQGVAMIRHAVSRQVSPKSSYRFQFATSFEADASCAAYDRSDAYREFVATRWQSEVSELEELECIACP